ncbi:MAG: type I glyceraldehyde-3-phosphate dehydrogenase [Planctomycetota bacterium]
MRISINGFGRIGRNVFRILQNTPGVEVVHINDLTDPATLAHLLAYDSVHGRYAGTVSADKDSITVDGNRVAITAERDPAALPHAANKIDFVVEATGVFASREACTKHLTAGAKKVLLTVPPKDEIDAMIVMGVNQDTLKATDRIISNASCTTNCLAPVAKVLHDSFGIVEGLMNTVHAYTNDQRILDLPHSDLRRARSAAINVIPTSTGAARAVGKVLPELSGKLDGGSMRVPVPDGSIVDLVAVLNTDVTKDSVNAALKAAAQGPMRCARVPRWTCWSPPTSSATRTARSSTVSYSRSWASAWSRSTSWYDERVGLLEPGGRPDALRAQPVIPLAGRFKPWPSRAQARRHRSECCSGRWRSFPAPRPVSHEPASPDPAIPVPLRQDRALRARRFFNVPRDKQGHITDDTCNPRGAAYLADDSEGGGPAGLFDAPRSPRWRDRRERPGGRDRCAPGRIARRSGAQTQ